MSISSDCLQYFPLLDNNFPILQDLPDPSFEIPEISDRVEAVAQLAISQEVDFSEKRKLELIGETLQLAKRRKSSAFSQDDDLRIISWKVGGLDKDAMAELLPGRTSQQIDRRLLYLTQRNPDLKDIILRAQEKLACLRQNNPDVPDSTPYCEMTSNGKDLTPLAASKAAKRTSVKAKQSDQLAKHRKLCKFTEAQDREILEGRVAGSSFHAILDSMGDGTGFTEDQIRKRYYYLAANHPELLDDLKAKKVKKFPDKIGSRFGYRWVEIEKKAPEFIQSVKVQMAIEKQELIAKLTDEGYSLMQIARRLNSQQ